MYVSFAIWMHGSQMKANLVMYVTHCWYDGARMICESTAGDGLVWFFCFFTETLNSFLIFWRNSSTCAENKYFSVAISKLCLLPFFGCEGGCDPPPQMWLCLSAETMSLHSVLSPPALMNSHPVLTVCSPPAACSLPLSQPCSLHTHLLWLMTCSAKSFLKQTTLFLNLAEVSFYQRSHQLNTSRACRLGDKGQSELRVFFFFYSFQIQPNFVNEWVNSVCDRMHALFWPCEPFPSFTGAYFFIFKVHVSHFLLSCKTCWACFLENKQIPN